MKVPRRLIHPAAHALAALLALALAACGFQLRGSVSLPAAWQVLHFQSPEPDGDLAQAVRDAFAAGDVAFTDATGANYRLHLGAEEYQQRNLSVGGDARAEEFELTLSASLRVSDAEGAELLPATELNVRRIAAHDPENITGTMEELRLLREEMREVLVQQVIRQVRIAAIASLAEAD